MIMNKLFSALGLLCLGVSLTFAQSTQDTKTLKAALDGYMTAVKNKNIDGVLDYMPPKMFETNSRENMKVAMSSENLQKVIYKALTVKKISPFFIHQKNKYALVKYLAVVIIPVPKDDKSKMESTFEIMKTMMGEDKVKLDTEKGEITLNSEAEMYAILNPQIKGWKFLGKSDQAPPIDGIIPKEVQEKLK